MTPSAGELAVRALVDQYVAAIEARDESAWGKTWDDDAVWIVAGREVAGRERITEAWRAAMARFVEVDHVVEVDALDIGADEGTGTWMVTERTLDRQGAELRLRGTYQDRYRRTDAGWRFAKRRLCIDEGQTT